MPINDIPGVVRPRVLSVGRDRALLQSRKYVLESAGFQVTTVAESCPPDVLSKMAAEQDVRALLLGQSVPLRQRLPLAHAVRRDAPTVGIVFFHYPGETFDARNCDALLAVPCPPEQMLAALRRALTKAADRQSDIDFDR